MQNLFFIFQIFAHSRWHNFPRATRIRCLSVFHTSLSPFVAFYIVDEHPHFPVLSNGTGKFLSTQLRNLCCSVWFSNCFQSIELYQILIFYEVTNFVKVMIIKIYYFYTQMELRSVGFVYNFFSVSNLQKIFK